MSIYLVSLVYCLLEPVYYAGGACKEAAGEAMLDTVHKQKCVAGVLCHSTGLCVWGVG